MLERAITTKQELIKIVQSAHIKRVVAEDIHTSDDIKHLCRAAEQLLRSNHQVTIFITTT